MHRQSFFLVPLICLSSALWAAPATVNVEVLQDKLDHPWALAFLPDNHGMLITLRGGELRHWQAGKGLSAPLSGVPDAEISPPSFSAISFVMARPRPKLPDSLFRLLSLR